MTIQQLSRTNEGDGIRTAVWDFTFERDGTVVAEVSCASPAIPEGESATMDCYSTSGQGTSDYDTVNVADSF